MTPFFKYFIKKVPKNNPPVFEDERLNYLAQQYWNYDWPSKAADLYKLQKMATKIYQRLLDTFIILSKRMTQYLYVKDLIENNIKSKKTFLILENSGHVVVNDSEREKVAQETLKWLKIE